MNMKRKILSLFILSLSVLSYGQEDYDEIFDDGINNSKLTIGTDIITLTTGTLNVNVGYNFTENFQLKLGVGATPFGFLLDANSFVVEGEGLPLIQSDLKTGYFLSVGTNFYTGEGLMNITSDGYYGVYLEKWKNTDSFNSVISYTRTKLNVVRGNSIALFGNFELNYEYGAYIGLFSLKNSITDPVQISAYDYISPERLFLYGLNLGLGINYKL